RSGGDPKRAAAVRSGLLRADDDLDEPVARNPCEHRITRAVGLDEELHRPAFGRESAQGLELERRPAVRCSLQAVSGRHAWRRPHAHGRAADDEAARVDDPDADRNWLRSARYDVRIELDLRDDHTLVPQDARRGDRGLAAWQPDPAVRPLFGRGLQDVRTGREGGRRAGVVPRRHPDAQRLADVARADDVVVSFRTRDLDAVPARRRAAEPAEREGDRRVARPGAGIRLQADVLLGRSGDGRTTRVHGFRLARRGGRGAGKERHSDDRCQGDEYEGRKRRDVRGRLRPLERRTRYICPPLVAFASRSHPYPGPGRGTPDFCEALTSLTMREQGRTRTPGLGGSRSKAVTRRFWRPETR